MKKILSIILIFLALVIFNVSASATTITIQSISIPNWQYATSAPKLRIYLDRGFITSDGIPLQPTAPGSRFFYKEITCTLLSNTLTIPSFTLDSTTDGQDITTARYSAWFYTTSGASIIGYAPFDQGFKLPYVISSTSGCSPAGTCTTWGDIRINNVVPAPNLDVTTYTKAQIDAKLLGVSGVPLTRSVGTTSPLTGGGTLAGNLTLSIPLATNSQDGYLSSIDRSAFNSKQSALGFTPENAANRNIAGGYAPLDGSILVPLVNIPTITNAKLQNSTINFSGDGTTITGGGYTALGSSATVFSVVSDSVNQRVQILNNGSSVGTRKAINFIPGSNVTLTVNDNSGSNRIDLTINSTASGTGDASTNTATSVDSEVVLFSSTTGKILKRATGTGVAHLTSGVLSLSNIVLTSEVTGILPLANGGTGSSTQNFVDLSSGQTVAGNKNLTGITQLQSATVNEPAWSTTGGTNLLISGADSTSGSPSSSVNPSETKQTYRNNGTLNVGIHAYNFAMYKTGGPGNAYDLNVFLKVTPNMSGFAAGEYFHTGINGHTYIGPTNVPGSGVTVTGYNLLKTELATTDPNVRAVGAQIEAVNSSGANASLGVTGNFTVALNVAGGGATQNTVAIEIEAVKATAFSKAFYPKGDSVFGTIIDLVDSAFHPQGTYSFTNGSSTITGSGSFATREFRKGDQITSDGVSWYEVASTPVSDTTITITSNFGGSTASGQIITKTVPPLRMIRPSYIVGTDGSLEYKIIGLAANNTVQLDKDGQGAYSGANFTAANIHTNKIMVGSVPDGGSDVYPGIWAGTTAVATPTVTNFILLYDPFSTNVLFNGGSGVDFRIGNQNKYSIDTNGLYPSGTTNTLDLGQSGQRIRTVYIGTSTSYTGVAFASLGTPANGTETFCTDCDPPTAINQACASAGAKTGAKALRRNSAWICY